MQENGAGNRDPPELRAAGSGSSIVLDEIGKDVTPRKTPDISFMAACGLANPRRWILMLVSIGSFVS